MTKEISVSLEYRVPYADTDQMKVVYHANYLKYFEMGRNELLRSLNYTYSEMEADGYGLPVIEAVCRYKKPARFEDCLTITAFVMEWKGIKIQIGCVVKRGEEVLSEGYTLHACLNREGKPCKLPVKLVNILDKFKA